MNEETKNYMIFTANCIHNDELDGNFEFYSSYTDNMKSINYKTSHNYSENYPAFMFQKAITTRKNFNVRNYNRYSGNNMVILTLIADGANYRVEITFYDKNANGFNNEDKWTTEPLSDQEFWGLTKKQINYVTDTLTKFYEKYVQAKRQRRLDVRQLQKDFLTDCYI